MKKHIIKLVHNEIIKVTKKAFSWSILIMILICSISLAYLHSRTEESILEDNYIHEYTNYLLNLQDKLENRDFKENEVEYIIALTEYNLYEILLLEEIPSYSWRFSFLSEIFLIKREMMLENANADTTVLDDFIKIAIDDDVTSYLSMKIESVLKDRDSYEENTAEFAKSEVDLWYYHYMLNNDIVPDQSDPLFLMTRDLYILKNNFIDESYLDNGDMTQSEKGDLVNEIALLTTRVESKNPQPAETKGLRFYLLISTNIRYIIIVYAIVLGVSIITDEYTNGNIFQYMTFPYSRKKKLFSKYFTISLILLVVIIFWLSITFLLAFITWGFGDINLPHIYALEGISYSIGYVYYILIIYSTIYLELMAFVFLSMLIAIATKNSYLSCCIVLVIYFLKANMASVISKLFGSNIQMLSLVNKLDISYGANYLFRNSGGTLSVIALLIVAIVSLLGGYFLYERSEW